MYSCDGTAGDDVLAEYHGADKDEKKLPLLAKAIVAYAEQAKAAEHDGFMDEAWYCVAMANFLAGVLYGKFQNTEKLSAVGRAGAEKRHSQPGGYRDLKTQVQDFYRSRKKWQGGKDGCAEVAAKKFNCVFSTARGYLRNI
ncbi:MAG: hypothetical protein LBE62_03495 [Azonexus sp.]|jgi:hypothetical protein|nr:hypothetical protein [Azonexus sp.]